MTILFLAFSTRLKHSRHITNQIPTPKYWRLRIRNETHFKHSESITRIQCHDQKYESHHRPHHLIRFRTNDKLLLCMHVWKHLCNISTHVDCLLELFVGNARQLQCKESNCWLEDFCTKVSARSTNEYECKFVTAKWTWPHMQQRYQTEHTTLLQHSSQTTVWNRWVPHSLLSDKNNKTHRTYCNRWQHFPVLRNCSSQTMLWTILCLMRQIICHEQDNHHFWNANKGKWTTIIVHQHNSKQTPQKTEKISSIRNLVAGQTSALPPASGDTLHLNIRVASDQINVGMSQSLIDKVPLRLATNPNVGH